MEGGVEIAALLLAAALAAAIGGFWSAQCGPMDTPNARSNHVRPRPRAGGLALLLGTGAGALALAFGAAPELRAALGPDAVRLGLILFAAGAWGLFGLLDDLSVIGLRVKFAGAVLLAVLAAWAAGPAPLLDFGAGPVALPWLAGLLGAALWVFIVVNAVNFMDGSNGMIAAGLFAAGAALAAFGLASGAPVAALCGVLLAGSFAGYAPFNAPRAQVFAGDTGALFAGALFACGALDLSQARPGAVWVAPLLLAPFLADVFATLIVRARRRAPLFDAHREHLYQLLIARGWTHLAVAMLYAGMGVVCALAAALALGRGPLAALATLLIVAVLGIGGVLALRRRLALHGTT